jgi:hypothetical protein
MLCVHNTDKPYYCEKCEEFFKIKTEYQEHVESKHPDDIPDDLKGDPLNTPTPATITAVKDNKSKKIQEKDQTSESFPPKGNSKKTPTAPRRPPSKRAKTTAASAAPETETPAAAAPASPTPADKPQEDEKPIEDSDFEITMPMEKMRTLLALLLKKISTPGRLKKLGFGTKLIDDVLKESIRASGRTPIDDEAMGEQCKLKKNIRILLDWTIPADYLAAFKAENRTIDEILEELAT